MVSMESIEKEILEIEMMESIEGNGIAFAQLSGIKIRVKRLKEMSASDFTASSDSFDRIKSDLSRIKSSL